MVSANSFFVFCRDCLDIFCGRLYEYYFVSFSAFGYLSAAFVGFVGYIFVSIYTFLFFASIIQYVTVNYSYLHAVLFL